jgi:hypothetical protein
MNGVYLVVMKVGTKRPFEKDADFWSDGVTSRKDLNRLVILADIVRA